MLKLLAKSVLIDQDVVRASERCALEVAVLASEALSQGDNRWAELV